MWQRAMMSSGGSEIIVYAKDVNLDTSSTKIRDVSSFILEKQSRLRHIDLSCNTNCGNNGGYVQVYVNDNIVYTPSERFTSNQKTSLSLDLNVNVNVNDVITIKTNWDNSHADVFWYFTNIRYKFY